MFDLLASLDEASGMLSVREVAQLFRVSEKTIRRMISRREIPTVLVGGQRRFDPKVLSFWYMRRSPEAKRLRRYTAEKGLVESATLVTHGGREAVTLSTKRE